MTTRETPWDEIRTPEADFNVRMIGGSKAVPIYWGKDAEGHCLFVVQLEGDHTEQFLKNRNSVRGISVDLRMLGTEVGQCLVLALEQHVDRDLFFGLCDTLVTSLREVPDSAAALSVALTHLRRWKKFLAGRKVRMLSPEEIRGLFAEIQFLRVLYRHFLPEKAAVDAWCGADGAHQDFIFGNTAVETKAVSGKERSSVRISSEDQLETLCDNLFLMVFRLSDMPESDLALSLNDVVRQVESELSDSSALENFFVQLVACGYVEMREYDEPKIVITGEKLYRVGDDFPRIIRSELPEGLRRVGYEIELEAITSFECEIAEIIKDT